MKLPRDRATIVITVSHGSDFQRQVFLGALELSLRALATFHEGKHKANRLAATITVSTEGVEESRSVRIPGEYVKDYLFGRDNVVFGFPFRVNPHPPDPGE